MTIHSIFLVNGSRYYNDLQAKTRLLLDRGVKCMSVLEHTRRSLCEITITCEKKEVPAFFVEQTRHMLLSIH
jgi:hypothetical protein